MKVILSRKGFDSAFGGYPSPILPNGKMDNKQTYFDLMRQLKPKIRFDKKWHELTKDTECHLDPDICPGVIPRMPNWKPCFGQINQAQSHLVNEGVKENDLFLFFGWFKNTILENDVLKFDESFPDLHVIFGYLQVGQILRVNERTDVPDWMQNHPHARNEQRKKASTNMIYIARENLTWDKSKPGAGIFGFNEGLVLTKKGFSRSKWDLPTFFKSVKISRHSEKSWKKEGYFKSVDIGQEFVVEDNEKVEDWAKRIIKNM